MTGNGWNPNYLWWWLGDGLLLLDPHYMKALVGTNTYNWWNFNCHVWWLEGNKSKHRDSTMNKGRVWDGYNKSGWKLSHVLLSILVANDHCHCWRLLSTETCNPSAFAVLSGRGAFSDEDPNGSSWRNPLGNTAGGHRWPQEMVLAPCPAMAGAHHSIGTWGIRCSSTKAGAVLSVIFACQKLLV